MFNKYKSMRITRLDLYNRMVGAGAGAGRAAFCAAMRVALYDPRSSATDRLCAAECLAGLALVLPSAVRAEIMQGPLPLAPQSSVNCLLWVVISGIIYDTESSVIEQLGDVLKVSAKWLNCAAMAIFTRTYLILLLCSILSQLLLDPERMERAEKDSFLTLFYDHYVIWLLEPFFKDGPPDAPLPPPTTASGATDSLLRARQVLY